MGDRSQDQDMSAVARDAQQVQATRDAIALQNSANAQVTIKRSFISLFGDRPVAPRINWDWVTKILTAQQPDLKNDSRIHCLGWRR